MQSIIATTAFTILCLSIHTSTGRTFIGSTTINGRNINVGSTNGDCSIEVNGVCAQGRPLRAGESCSIKINGKCFDDSGVSTGSSSSSHHGSSGSSSSSSASCVFRYECPNGKYCKNMNCVQDPRGRQHIAGKSCIFESECPQGHRCSDMTCIRY